MYDVLRKRLMGREINGVGVVNHQGQKHVRLELGEDRDVLLVPLDNVMITLASHKPVGRAMREPVSIAV
jgi:hypothetical protein